MEKSIFFASVFLVMAGCIFFEKTEEPFLSFCQSIDLNNAQPVFIGNETYIFLLPQQEIFSMSGWQPVLQLFGSPSPCYFGWLKGENKNYLYCSNKILFSLHNERTSKKQLVEIFIDTVFKKQGNSFELVERRCRVYLN